MPKTLTSQVCIFEAACRETHRPLLSHDANRYDASPWRGSIYHRAERNRFYAISPFKPDLRGKSWDSQRRARNCAAKQWYCNGRVGLSSIALRAEHVPAALCQVCNVNGSRDACTLRAEKQFDRSFELVN